MAPQRKPTTPTTWQILTSLGEAVVVVDRDLRVLWCRDPLLALHRPGATIVGQHCYAALLGQREPCTDGCPVQPVFATGRPHAVERRFMGPDGSEQWREARAYPIVDGQGRVAYAARISFDITQRKLRQAARRRDREALERSLSELNRLQVDQLPFQPAAALTRRELEVLRLLAQGLSKPRIAVLLGISANTVKRHVTNIFNKLGVNDRAQAAVWAARQGLV